MVKKVVLTTTVVILLAAAGLSAVQLTKAPAAVSGCLVGTPCTATTVCGRSCFCLIAEGETIGACEPNTIPQIRKDAGLQGNK